MKSASARMVTQSAHRAVPKLRCVQFAEFLEYAEGRSRSRVLENILDTMKVQVNCPHSALGCKGTVLRKDFKDHAKTCSFK